MNLVNALEAFFDDTIGNSEDDVVENIMAFGMGPTPQGGFAFTN